MAKIFTNTKGMSRDKWVEMRRHGIGGSDAAAIIGLDKYTTPYSVWADKKGLLPEKEDTEAMRLGRDLEEYVAMRFEEETGKKVRRKNAILQHEDFPFMLANIDREVVGEKAGLECKTTSILNTKMFKNGEFPEKYYAQCVHYLAVTGYDRWYLAVLVLGEGFYVYTLERDEEEIAALINAESTFWNVHVIADVPPAVDGLAPTTNAMDSVFKGKDDDEVIHLNVSDILRSYMEVKETIARFEHIKELYEQQLKGELGDFQQGVCGDWDITWKCRTRRTFDAKRFAEDNPNLDLSKYYKESAYRAFGVKAQKKKKED